MKSIDPTWQSKDGRVKLWLGNCIEIMKSWEESSIDFIFTDPPYGHNNNDGDLIANREKALGVKASKVEMEARPIANDGVEANDLFKQMLIQSKRILKPGRACCCCCGGGGPDPQFARWSMWMNSKLKFKHMIVWDKGPIGMGWHYRRSYETILVATKHGGKEVWNGGADVENIIRPSMWGVRKIIPSKSQHPTEKPAMLSSCFIQWHSNKNDIVVDPFMGSGSTAESAIRIGRQFYGIEIDPIWFERSKERAKRALKADPMLKIIKKRKLKRKDRPSPPLLRKNNETN